MAQFKFSQWLEMQYIEWMRRSSQRKTLTAFADWIGVSQSQLSRYMAGKITPNKDNLQIMAEKLGPEIYDVLGLLRPDLREARLLALFRKLDEIQKDALIATLDKNGPPNAN